MLIYTQLWCKKKYLSECSHRDPADYWAVSAAARCTSPTSPAPTQPCASSDSLALTKYYQISCFDQLFLHLNEVISCILWINQTYDLLTLTKCAQITWSNICHPFQSSYMRYHQKLSSIHPWQSTPLSCAPSYDSLPLTKCNSTVFQTVSINNFPTFNSHIFLVLIY